jgi:antitoxin VapB
MENAKLSHARLSGPKHRGWDDFFEHGPSVSDDFMNERIQPPAGTREQAIALEAVEKAPI